MLDDLLRYLGLQEDADGLMWLKSKQNGDIPFSPGLVKAVIDSGKGLRAQADVPASLKRYASPEVRFLFQIVANDDTGIDVDRFDYFRRDTYNAGAQTAYNPMRLVNSARIVEGQIAFPEKEFPNLRLMFQTRFNLFKHVYTHRVSEAINLMVVDALLKADGALRISSMVHNPAMYVHLTDGILDQIAASAAHGWRCMCGDPEPCDKNSESEHFKSMAQARGLVERIRKRDLYQLAFEKVFYNRTLYRDLTRAAKEDGLKNQILEKDSTEKLRRDDFHVDLASIHHGDKENDPMVKVLFFSKDKPDKLLLLPRDTPLPDLDGPFIEYRLRVYARNREHTKDIHAAAKAWLKSLTPGN
ncbi:hypothetical protein, variant [Fonticula alba]|nr:hypothetical protein, variant [Fonticula alba]KCV68397.1 hypothetical protein, variant [Fonticula alba]|eukprot:XP_009496829.1 hypothetical protein, variant [Fonticula alba]